jgi:hypothetical protein
MTDKPETVKAFMGRVLGWNWNTFDAMTKANNGKDTDWTNLLVLALAGAAEMQKIAGDGVLVSTDQNQ